METTLSKKALERINYLLIIGMALIGILLIVLGSVKPLV